MLHKMIKLKKITLKSRIKTEYIFAVKNNKVYMIKKEKKKKKKSKIKYLYYNKRLKQGVFLKTPTYKELSYPFSFNLKLISQYLYKK